MKPNTQEIRTMIAHRRWALRKNQRVIDATTIHLLNGRCTFKPIRLDPGCTDFGKSIFTRGGSIPVMFDYSKGAWYEIPR